MPNPDDAAALREDEDPLEDEPPMEEEGGPRLSRRVGNRLGLPLRSRVGTLRLPTLRELAESCAHAL